MLALLVALSVPVVRTITVRRPSERLFLLVGDTLRVRVENAADGSWDPYVERDGGLEILDQRHRGSTTIFSFRAERAADTYLNLLNRSAVEGPNARIVGRRHPLRQFHLNAAVYRRDRHASPMGEFLLSDGDDLRQVLLPKGHRFAIELDGAWRVDPLPLDLVRPVQPVARTRRVRTESRPTTRLVLRTVGTGEGEIELFTPDPFRPPHRWRITLRVE